MWGEVGKGNKQKYALMIDGDNNSSDIGYPDVGVIEKQ